MRLWAFRSAGILWLVLGCALILTVVGPFVGVALAYLVGVRRSVPAARLGSALGLLMFLPGQLVLEMAGCNRDSCGLEPYLLADGLPALVATLNGIAGWRPTAEARGSGRAGPLETVRSAPGAGVAPGQQSLWPDQGDQGFPTDLAGALTGGHGARSDDHGDYLTGCTAGITESSGAPATRTSRV